MMGCSEKLTEAEIGLIYSQALLNSKIIALIENKLEHDHVKAIRGKENQLAIYSSNKRAVFFPAKTEHTDAVDLFVHLSSAYSIKIIEGSREIIEKIGAHLSEKPIMAYQSNMLLFTRMIDETVDRIGVECEFIQGADLLNFGIEVIIGKFAREKLGENLSEEEIKARAISTSREFIGLKMDGKIVSVGAWTRKHLDNRCISYVYTDEKYRGHGFGHLIISALINNAKGKYKCAFLFVEETNCSAIALYKKCGFATSGRVSQLKIPDLQQYAKH